MITAVIIFFSLVVASALITLGILYLRYSSSSAAQWKRRVQAEIQKHRDELRSAERAEASIDSKSESQRIRDHFLDRHLRGLAVEELSRFPGIGPVTVSRLRDAQVTNIASCSKHQLSRIPGVGPSRLADLMTAVRQVTREAESRFTAGACKEAIACAAELQQLNAKLAERRRAAKATVRREEEALAVLEKRERIARGITFFGHLFGQEVSGLTDELMDAPLTDPEPVSPPAIPVGKIEKPKKANSTPDETRSTPIAPPRAPLEPAPVTEVPWYEGMSSSDVPVVRNEPVEVSVETPVPPAVLTPVPVTPSRIPTWNELIHGTEPTVEVAPPASPRIDPNGKPADNLTIAAFAAYMKALLRSRTSPDERDRKMAHREAEMLLAMVQGRDASGRATVEAMISKMDIIAEPVMEDCRVVLPAPTLPAALASSHPNPISDWVNEPLIEVGSIAAVPQRVDDSSISRLRVVAGFGFAVARADGRIAASERKQVRAFLERRYAQWPDVASQLDAVLTEIGNDVPTIGDALWDVRKVIPKDQWPELYQFALSVVDAAGERNARETDCLNRVAEEFGIGAKSPTATDVQADPRRASPPLPDGLFTEGDCRQALEIAASTELSVELIRRQYRLLSDRFALERFNTHGSEFIAMAADRRSRAERAALQLLAAYNEPLEPTVAPPPSDSRHNPDLDAAFGA